MRYQVTTYDYACSGMERLRNRDEIILIAYPTPSTTDDALLDEILDDVGSVERPDDFDFDAARSALVEYFDAATLSHIINGSNEPGDEDEDGAQLFVYLRQLEDALTPTQQREAFAALVQPLRVTAPTESSDAPDGGFRAGLWLGPCHVADVSVFPDDGPIRLLYRAAERTRSDDTIRTWWMSNDFDTVEALRSELGL